MKNLFLVLPILIGLAIALQAAINSQLRVAVNNPLLAALVSFSVGTILILTVVLVTKQTLPTTETIMSLKWYQLTGGILGAFMVFSVILTVPKIGTANMFSIIVASQLIAALILDHFGLLGLKTTPINGYRAAGVLLLVIGAILVNKK